MRKNIKTFLAMFLICLSSFAIFGCGAKVTKLEYVEGSMDTTLVVGEELVTTGFKAKATMSNDTVVNLTEKDVDFNDEELDLTTPGNKELEYSYKGVTDTIDLVVMPANSAVSSLEYTGTMPTEIGLGDDIDLTNFAAKVTYADGTTITLDKDDVVFNKDAVDLTTTGEKYLPFTFQGKTNYVTFTIIESTEISSFVSNVNVDFDANTNGEESPFKIKGVNADIYHVGDYNDYDPRISAKGYIIDEENIDVTEKTIKTIATETKVEKLTSVEPKTYTELTENEYDLYFDKLSDVNGIMNFSPDAVGQEFKITISSKYFDANTYTEAPKFTQIVKVVSGYNVYDVKGLSLLDNSNKDVNSYYGWDQIKSNEEIALSDNINSLILHKDIQIEDKDLPTTLFWSKAEVGALTAEQKAHTNLEIEGSLKDGAGLALFHRRSSGDFKIFGNYYTIDSSKVAKCVLDWDYTKTGATEKHGIIVDKDAATDEEATNEQAITIHSNLILITPMSTTTAYKKFDIENVSFLGNGPRSNRSIYSGGHILLKAQGVKLNIDNCTHKDYFIGYFANRDDGAAYSEADQSSFRFENCIGGNSYNTLFYIYGARDVKIVDSEFVSAGGPGMVIDHVGQDDDKHPNSSVKGFPSYVDIINSTVESFVTGKEAWFATYPVAQGLFSALTPANALFAYANVFTAAAGINKTATFMQTHGEIENAINVVAVVKTSDAQDAVGGEIYGRVTIKSSENDTSAHGLDLQGTSAGLSKKAMSTLTIIPGGEGEAPQVTGIPYFESHKTGSYINAAIDENKQPIDGLFDMDLKVDNDSTRHSFAEGDYLNVYLHIGMGAIFGMQDTTPQA